MKINSTRIIIILLAIILIFVVVDNNRKVEPNVYYRVYLDGEDLGTIKSKSKLEKYINEKGNYIKNKYGVNNISSPVGLEVEKVLTYSDKIMSVEDIYKKINDKSYFTIKGYQFTLKDADESMSINVLDKQVFEKAINNIIEIFVGDEEYSSYLSGVEKKIETTGTLIENIYLEENVTVKEKQIPIDEEIFTDIDTLTSYLLFGSEKEETVYTVKIGDTIKSIAFDNEISTEEFLMSNPTFTNENNLVYPGQQVVIALTNPKIKVVVEEYVVEDRISKYITEEKIDEDRLVGDDEVVQKGEDGLNRVTQNVKKINGGIVFVDPKAKIELKPTINEVVIVGGKKIANVGSLHSWGWPTSSGWVISDDYEWRINPVTYKRELHSGIDIAGTGYGSSVYASNNGTVIKKTYANDYGYYIIINHNNGYYSVYAHLSKFNQNISVGKVVSRGDVIGYVGSTGYSTGPHLHYEIWKGCEYCRINPWNVYK